jgi:hypothetical protein
MNRLKVSGVRNQVAGIRGQKTDAKEEAAATYLNSVFCALSFVC